MMTVVPRDRDWEGEETRVQAEARDWVMRVSEAPEMEAECAAWRAADPAHEAAWREISQVWQAAPSLAALVGDDWRAEAAAIGRSPVGRARQWALRGNGRLVLPLAMAASLVAAIALPSLTGPAAIEHATATAETRIVALDDGSRVTLGARSGVAVRYAADERQVVLEDGQAFFEVAPNAARPFVVLAGNAEIRVTGTKFDVRVVGGDVQVAVLEGRVELRRRPLIALLRAEAPARVVTAGERVELEEGESFTPETRATVTPGEWRSGRLYYSETPLDEIVADIQRYSRTPIRIADRRTGALKLTTSFRGTDIDQFISNLETALPIEARRNTDGGITLAAR